VETRHNDESQWRRQPATNTKQCSCQRKQPCRVTLSRQFADLPDNEAEGASDGGHNQRNIRTMAATAPSDNNERRSDKKEEKLKAALVVGVGQELREVLTTWKKETRYHRALALGLNNLTSATLVRPQWWLESGRMDKAPAERVRPNEASASFWTKKGGAARGSVGVLTYDIEGSNRSIAIMWSVPYSYALYDNWFNVHIVDTGTVVDWTLFRRLYSQDPDKAKNGVAIRAERGFKVTGEMENKKIAALIVTIQAL